MHETTRFGDIGVRGPWCWAKNLNNWKTLCSFVCLNFSRRRDYKMRLSWFHVLEYKYMETSFTYTYLKYVSSHTLTETSTLYASHLHIRSSPGGFSRVVYMPEVIHSLIHRTFYSRKKHGENQMCPLWLVAACCPLTFDLSRLKTKQKCTTICI